MCKLQHKITLHSLRLDRERLLEESKLDAGYPAYCSWLPFPGYRMPVGICDYSRQQHNFDARAQIPSSGWRQTAQTKHGQSISGYTLSDQRRFKLFCILA